MVLASTSAQIHLHSSRNALICVGSSVSSTAKQYIPKFQCIQFSFRPSLLLPAVLVGSPLFLAVVLWVYAQS